MASDLAGVWPTDKRLRLTDAMQDLDDIAEHLQDETLSHAARARYYGLRIKLRHAIAEECGQLPTRMAVEVDAAPRLQSMLVLSKPELSMLTDWYDPGHAAWNAERARTRTLTVHELMHLLLPLLPHQLLSVHRSRSVHVPSCERCRTPPGDQETPSCTRLT
jgi:hypothetical protein